MAKATTNAAKNSKATSKAQKAQDAAKSAKASAAAPKANAAQNGNPFRQGGGYWASVEALRALGIGKMHDHAKVLPAVRKAMGAGWKEFAAKKGGKMTADERALCNVMVTSRDDYGAPLRKLGWEVRWDGRQKLAGLFRVGSK